MLKKRLVSLLLCLVLLLQMIPTFGIPAICTEDDAYLTNYGAAIGTTALFNTTDWSSFLAYDRPENFDYDVDWDNNEYWLHCETDSETPDIQHNQPVVITNYYYDEETAALWYQLKPVPGQALGEKLTTYPWVFQNYADVYTEDNWESFSPNSLLIKTPKNYIFNENGEPITNVTMMAYDEVPLECKTSLQGIKEYQWQILLNNEWINIADAEQATFTVTGGLLLNAVTEENLTASIRCVAKSGSQIANGDAIGITVEPYTPVTLSSSRTFSAYGADEPTDEEEYCYLTVKYLFENGVEAANPFVAKILRGETLPVPVEFPKVQGYLSYYGGVQQDRLEISETIDQDTVYTVYYLPTEVDYTIDVYFQNVNDDNYTYQFTKTLQGLTGSIVPHDTTLNYEGMYELLHETPAIAANGSTHLEVYFNRIYYLTHFELDGGYGVYSIYARYGTPLDGHIGTPIKAGHTFVGWDLDPDGEGPATGDGIADRMPATVPIYDNEERERWYTAIWQANPTAEVRIAFWGENPNDEGYSYIESQVLNVAPGTEVTYDTSRNICGITAHTHGTDCHYKCGLAEHTHDAGCYNLTCTEELHEAHTDDCYNCGITGHTHSKDCYKGLYGNVFSESFSEWRVEGTETNGSIGQSYHIYGTGTKYIYLDGTWYKYTGTVGIGGTQLPNCGKTESTHIHNDECSLSCTKKLHSHTGSCYTLTCTTQEHSHQSTCYDCVQHTHDEACRISPFEGYDASKWTLVKSETKTVASDGSTVINVYFDRTSFTLTFRKNGSTNGEVFGTINQKWGAVIIDQFNAIGEKAGTNSWCTTVNATGSRTNYIRIMPAANRTYYSYYETGSERVATYYGEKLDGSGYEILMEVKITRRNNTNITAEDFAEFEGYNFSHGSKEGDSFGGAKFYYTRKELKLEFFTGDTDAEKTEIMQYGESFSKFNDYTPDLPSKYEPGSRRFVAWYLNPECTDEARVNLNELTMPAENMALYAKWELIKHNVRIFKTKNDDGTFGDPVLPGGVQPDPVLHGHKVFDSDYTLPIPENAPYTFVGWFYMDGNNERMWNFEHTVVNKDVDIYAKWSAEVLVPYTVRFKIKGTDIEIAEPISRSALAGTTVTFNAKTGTELVDGYQSGYFPETTSHSLTMDATQSETGMTYTFEYVARKIVPYTVRYVDRAGNNLIEPKVVSDNTYAVVTEKFVFIDDYAPDEFQKTLILSGAEGAVNEIVFVYTKDSTLGVYHVIHYIQNTTGTGYIEHSNYGDVGTINDVLNIPVLELTGFTFKEATVNGASATPHNGAISGTITKEGLEVIVYYTRNKYPYKIQYLDEDTLDPVKDPVIVTEGAYFGSSVTEKNPPDIENYQYESTKPCVIEVEDAADPTKNVVNVYYSEQSVRINYEVSGPEGCGTVDPTYTDVKVLSGTGAASTAKANDGFAFEGWYEDAACNRLVTTNDTLNLTIPDDRSWNATTYFAKFVPTVEDLTIHVTGAAVTDDQTFLFKVVGKAGTKTEGIDLTVAINGNGSKTITELPIGDYTVSELTGWSWRYATAPDQTKTLVYNVENEVTFALFREKGQWLDGNHAKDNAF